MMGISYGGISQLFVAETDPPDLAAIGAAVGDRQHRHDAVPGRAAQHRVRAVVGRGTGAGRASGDGEHRRVGAYKRIQGGDETCKANQVLHGEAVNLIAKVRADAYHIPSVADPLDPAKFVNRIKVPVYLACQWTNKQTGGHCADLAEHFTGTAHKWLTFTNGTHIDSLDPATFMRWYDFLELYVARQAPRLSASVKGLAPALFNSVMGVPNVTLPSDPIQSEPTYAAALAAFQALPPVRILFDNGAGSPTAGAPGSSLRAVVPRAFRSPGPRRSRGTWAGGGALAAAPPTPGGADEFTWNSAALPATDFSGNTSGGPGGLWSAIPPYNWEQNPPGPRSPTSPRR